ncbi:glycosyltransferase family 2 protein [bacterium]|nr:glycosyltransferase family 2 protein [bacterium]MBI9073649.1 glycosyltransferase family 2 protein [Melioribacteraceae bacterium]
MTLPSLSIVIPTYNSSRTLSDCLQSIHEQDYPKDKIEIIIADAGSSDGTVEIARKYTDKIYPNPLKTGEAGKAVGVKHATGKIIALIDSDNILPENDWLFQMIVPFSDAEIVGTEPLYYTYRKEDGLITRYCALIGMNDPLCMFMGNYDRMNLITGKWTEMPVDEEDMGDYLKVGLDEKKLPTIGANGFLIRKEILDNCSIGDYLFDIDVVYELVMQGQNKFAKVKTGIVHIFSGTISTFIKKQRRRIKDYGYYEKKGIRKYPWSTLSKGKLLKFIVYTILVFPLLGQAGRGWIQKKDIAWVFHIFACWITLIVYGYESVNKLFNSKIEDRDKW